MPKRQLHKAELGDKAWYYGHFPTQGLSLLSPRCVFSNLSMDYTGEHWILKGNDWDWGFSSAA